MNFDESFDERYSQNFARYMWLNPKKAQILLGFIYMDLVCSLACLCGDFL